MEGCDWGLGREEAEGETLGIAEGCGVLFAVVFPELNKYLRTN